MKHPGPTNKYTNDFAEKICLAPVLQTKKTHNVLLVLYSKISYVGVYKNHLTSRVTAGIK